MAEGIATSVPTSAVTVEAPQHNEMPLMASTSFLIPEELWGMFDVSDHRITQSSRSKDQMRDIMSYFWEQNRDGDINDVLLGIRETMNTFAAPTFNTNRFEQMAHFVGIQRQISSLQKKQKAITNATSNIR